MIQLKIDGIAGGSKTISQNFVSNVRTVNWSHFPNLLSHFQTLDWCHFILKKKSQHSDNFTENASSL